MLLVNTPGGEGTYIASHQNKIYIRVLHRLSVVVSLKWHRRRTLLIKSIKLHSSIVVAPTIDSVENMPGKAPLMDTLYQDSAGPVLVN